MIMCEEAGEPEKVPIATETLSPSTGPSPEYHGLFSRFEFLENVLNPNVQLFILGLVQGKIKCDLNHQNMKNGINRIGSALLY